MRRRKTLVFMLVFCLALGGWLAAKYRAEEQEQAKWRQMDAPYRATVRGNRYWIKKAIPIFGPSSTGKICGLLDVLDAENITGVVQDKLLEYNNTSKFPGLRANSAKDIGMTCEISFDGKSERKAFYLRIDHRDFTPGAFEDPFAQFLATGQEAAKEGQSTVEIRGKNYAGEVSTTQGGYVVRTCPKGGQYVVTLATTDSGALGVLGAWREPLLRVLTETERIGACAVADASGPNSENVRNAKETQRLRPIPRLLP
jgi:hypothetical protein